MDCHERMILKQRVRPAAVGRCCDEGLERIGRSHHQREEEGGDGEDHDGGPPDQRVGSTLPELVMHDREVPGENKTPKQNRALKGRPAAGDRVKQRRFECVVVTHVLKGEIVGQEGPLHGGKSDHRSHQY